MSLARVTIGLVLALLAPQTQASAQPPLLDPEPARVTQPRQPAWGPGGRDYRHRVVRVTSGGTGANAWYLFEPRWPKPSRAALAIVLHGYYEFAGYRQLTELIRHTVRTGRVVIYPRWQTGIADPCPGPYDIEPCHDAAVAGIRGALRFLREHPRRVQPQLRRTSYFGFSFGGIITANLANRWRVLGLPKPRAIFLDDPHDGGLISGQDEPALDDSLAGISRSVKLQCHSGASGVIREKPNQSCNAVWPKLLHIPARNKALVMTRDDRHGTPGLSSGHGVCATPRGAADAYDWGFCWKVWDALQTCAYRHDHCGYALGGTRRHRFIGSWSDGRRITPLTAQAAAPLRPR